jgi:hypothetical protein
MSDLRCLAHELLLTLLHLAVMTAKLRGPGGVRAVMAENLLLKQQLIVLRRARQRAPNLALSDRLICALGSLFLSPGRIGKVAIGVRPRRSWRFIRRWCVASTADCCKASIDAAFVNPTVVSVLNPKTALFFLAVLRQFVTPSKGAVTLQCAFLGSVFVLIALCTDTSWSLAASGVGSWLRRHPRFVASERYVAGSVYLTLGVAAAVSWRRD